MTTSPSGASSGAATPSVTVAPATPPVELAPPPPPPRRVTGSGPPVGARGSAPPAGGAGSAPAAAIPGKCVVNKRRAGSAATATVEATAASATAGEEADGALGFRAGTAGSLAGPGPARITGNGHHAGQRPCGAARARPRGRPGSAAPAAAADGPSGLGAAAGGVRVAACATANRAGSPAAASAAGHQHPAGHWIAAIGRRAADVGSAAAITGVVRSGAAAVERAGLVAGPSALPVVHLQLGPRADRQHGRDLRPQAAGLSFTR